MIRLKLTTAAGYFVLAASLLLIPACSTGQNTNIEGTEPSKIVEPQINDEPAPVKELAYEAPLTGLRHAEPITRRPMAVMINNAPAARPQSGLQGADMVYEVLAEGGVTRLIAIYHSGGDGLRIGPVRSIRPYMIDLGESYHGVLVHAGASNDAFAILRNENKEDLDEITNAGAYFWRDKSRKAPHNLYSNLDKLMEGAAKRKYATEDKTVPAYTFWEEDKSVEGEDVTNITIKFQLNNYLVSYEYDAASKLYKRSVNGESHSDLDSGEQLTATNLVVLGADHKVLDDVGRLSVDLELGGEALVLQKGKLIRGQWIRKEGDVIRIIKDNMEIPFYPGNTFFHIVPNAPDFDSHITLE